MQLLALLLLLIGGLLTGWAGPAEPPPDAGPLSGPAGQIVSGPGYTGVIMPPAAAETMVSLFVAVHPRMWTPSSDQISRLEADWRAHLHKEGASNPPLDIAAGGYRQYAGFIRDGQHLILVNSFCSTSVIEGLVDWTREPVFVMDGGSCFYHVTYNVETGEFSDLAVNGIA